MKVVLLVGVVDVVIVLGQLTYVYGSLDHIYFIKENFIHSLSILEERTSLVISWRGYMMRSKRKLSDTIY